MALDLAILDSNGRPQHSIQVGLLAHNDVIRLINALGEFPLLQRMADYYQDVTYLPDEINPLLDEIRRLPSESELRAFPPVREEVLELLSSLAALWEVAEQEQNSIDAIAD